MSEKYPGGLTIWLVTGEEASSRVKAVLARVSRAGHCSAPMTLTKQRPVAPCLSAERRTARLAR